MSRKKKNDTLNNIEEGLEVEKEVSLEEKISNITEETLPTALNTVELNELIGEPIENNTKEKKQSLNKKQKQEKEYSSQKNHFFVHTFLILVLIICLIYFGFSITDNNSTLFSIIHDLLITVFTILFVSISITYNRSKKGMIFLSSLLLIGYFLIGINGHINLVKTPSSSTPDFRGKSLTSAIKWANKNHVSINQEYEYSDMVPEYKIISQTTNESKKKNITDLTVSISEGPNPAKEIMVPNMKTWKSERVLNYILDNHLNNVLVEFVESDKAKDTVIEQSASGNLKRSDELKLTFSSGEELDYSEVKIIDFTNKSKFEVEFYMKQHHLNYEFKTDFSNKSKKGYAIRQSKNAGDKVKINDEKIEVTISKGPKIKVPNLGKMDITKITEWAIKNRIKISFIDKYDSKIKENSVIEADHKTGDIVEQGSLIKVTISRGALKMPKFKSLNDFHNWANKYEIKYEEKHEFSDKVKVGEVIKYSYNAGDAIKNDDIIIVTISDGEKTTVPNLKGLSKDEATSKLKELNLKYTFIYNNSNNVKKNYVISQSISAGSEISSNTTITVTLSNGKNENSKKTEEKKIITEPTSKNSNSSNNNNSNTNKSSNSSSSNNNSTANNNTSNTTTTNNNNNNTPNPPVNNCTNVTVYIYPDLISNVPSTTCSNIKGAYPKLKFSCSYVKDSGLSNGLLKNASSVDEKSKSTCETISLVIVNNN